MNKHRPLPAARLRLAALSAAVAATLSAALAVVPAIAAPHELLAAQPGDLTSAVALAPAAAPAAQSVAAAPRPSHDTVALSWIATGAVAAPSPYLAQSRQSYQTVTAAQLAAGVPLHTTSAHALVRVQAVGATGPREQLAIHPRAMTLTDSAGKDYIDGAGMDQLISDDKLAKADLPFAPGTSAFRLHPALGAGTFKLKADGIAGADRYLINVVEPDSPYALTMQAAAPHYLHGQTLVLQADLREGADAAPRRHALARLDAVAVSPAGRRFPLSFKPGADGRMRAQLLLDADEAPAPGLWEVHGEATAAVKGQTVVRSLRLAFPVALPVARLDHGVALADGKGGVRLNVGLEAAAAGRYEVRAMLYGMVNGALAPLGVADAAQWMEPGSGSIALTFAPELIANASGPFELRDLFLLDQGRMGVLHRQQRALVLSEDDVVRAGGRAAAATAVTPAALPQTQTQTAHVKRAPNAVPGGAQ